MTGCEIIHCKYWFNSREANGVCTYDGPCIYGTPREGELQAANAELNVKLAEAEKLVALLTGAKQKAIDESDRLRKSLSHCSTSLKMAEKRVAYLEITMRELLADHPAYLQPNKPPIVLLAEK